jgi:hypothetical protein
MSLEITWYEAHQTFLAALHRWEARWDAPLDEWEQVQRLHDEAYRLLHAPPNPISSRP